MKKIYKIGLVIIALIISQAAFPQKENAKAYLRGEQQIELSEGYSFISSRIIAENPDKVKDLISKFVTKGKDAKKEELPDFSQSV